MKYNSVLSLGSNCAVAGQIQRYFGGNPQSPFDSLIEVLKTNGRQLGLRCSAEFLGTTAYCESYGLLYHHEFKRKLNNNIIFDVDSLVNLRNKILHKWSTFREVARSSSPLFIRYLTGTNVPTDRLSNKLPITRNDIISLQSNLEILCGHPNFHIALFRSNGCQYDLYDFDFINNIDNISFHEENYQGEGVLGEDNAWNKFFINFNLLPQDKPLGISYKF
jgi:hypothetical protein